MTSTTEKQFHTAMVNIYKRAKDECGYHATYFLKMVSELGGLEAAKRLLRSKKTQHGFGELQKHGRLDLTVEAHVLKPEFSPLFTEAECQEARDRLEEFGYFVDKPKQDNFLTTNNEIKKTRR